MSDAISELRARIRETPVNPQRIGELLDALPGAACVDAVRSLGGADQRRLYRAVDGHRPLRLIDLVPPAQPALTQVRHYGRNSLPLLALINIFEKRFYRPTDADPNAPAELHGANFMPISPLIGQGYFVVAPHPSRPELCIDYLRLPARAPQDWPPIRRNERGLSSFVYGYMVDTLRAVSDRVTIGSAARKGHDMDSYFVLCREGQS